MNTKVLGKKGEELALEYLNRHGCRLIARNFRVKLGEVDLIVLDAGCLCFVEVKARKYYQTPQEAVHKFKQKKLTQLARIYLKDYYPQSNIRCRFDVIAVDQEGSNSSKIEWFKNAFDAVE